MEILAVRPAVPTDLPAMERICCETVDMGHDPRPERRCPELIPAVWLTPYMLLPGTTCLVAVRGAGVPSEVRSEACTRAPEAPGPGTGSGAETAAETSTGAGDLVLGYCIAAWDARAFAQVLDTRWWPDQRARFGSRVASFTPADLDTWSRIIAPEPIGVPWSDDTPAELHIDLSAEARGAGVGRRLITAMCEDLAGRGIPGVHLGVDPLNTGAIAFYRRMGFTEMCPADEGGPVFGRQLG